MVELKIPILEIPTVQTEPILQHQGQRLYQPKAIEHPDNREGDQACMRKVLSWLEGFLMQAQPDKGRPRPICPFIKPSMDNGLLYLSVLNLPMPNSLESLYRAMQPYRELLLQLEPTAGPLADLKSFLILLPDASPTVMEALMDINSPYPLKTEWLEAGVMIGQFYPTCPFRAAWNWRVFLHQSPIPFFVVRPLIEQDWHFIYRHSHWQEIYLKRFGVLPAMPERSWSQRIQSLPLKLERWSQALLQKNL